MSRWTRSSRAPQRWSHPSNRKSSRFCLSFIPGGANPGHGPPPSSPQESWPACNTGGSPLNNAPTAEHQELRFGTRIFNPPFHPLETSGEWLLTQPAPGPILYKGSPLPPINQVIENGRSRDRAFLPGTHIQKHTPFFESDLPSNTPPNPPSRVPETPPYHGLVPLTAMLPNKPVLPECGGLPRYRPAFPAPSLALVDVRR